MSDSGSSLAEEGDDIAVARIGTITATCAQEMVEAAAFMVDDLGVKGCLLVFGMAETRMPLAQQMFGRGTFANYSVAWAKARTVQNTGRSTHKQREYMKEQEIDPANYAGMVETTFSGGIRLFSDRECTNQIGVAAFSGGSEEEDMTIVDYAAQDKDLYTDAFEPMRDYSQMGIVTVPEGER